jgi:hypothetical protein
LELNGYEQRLIAGLLTDNEEISLQSNIHDNKIFPSKGEGTNNATSIMEKQHDAAPPQAKQQKGEREIQQMLK